MAVGGGKRKKRVMVPFELDEHERIKAAAKLEKLPVTLFIRRAMEAASAEVLKQKPNKAEPSDE